MVQGSGSVRRDERAIAGVDGVRFVTMGSLLIAQGAQERLTVEADDNVLPLLTSAVADGTLVLGITPGAGFSTRSPIVHRLTVRHLRALACAGSGEVTATGLAADERVAISGSGGFHARDLLCRTSSVRISGLGDAEVHADATLDATVSGSGSVRYAGAPTVTSRVTGSGSVDRL
jgi:hypothetical protein